MANLFSSLKTKYSVEILKKEYEKLDLKYRELLTKYAILDNIHELVKRKSEIFKELQELEAKLDIAKVTVSQKENLDIYYDAENLFIGIVDTGNSENRFVVKAFNYLNGHFEWSYDELKYKGCKVYKDIDDASNYFGIDAEKNLVEDKTNINIISWIRYLDLAKLIGLKIPRNNNVSISDVRKIMNIIASYDLNKLNLSEIVYSLDANKKQKRRIKKRK